MNTLRHFPLGESIIDSIHAIASSLPTLNDVCGYEEGDTKVLSQIKVGYPRFVVHPYIRRLTNLFLDRNASKDRDGILVASFNTVRDLLKYAGPELQSLEVENGLYLIHFDAFDTELADKIYRYLQHVGCGISSRQAEALLLKIGRLFRPYVETLFDGDADKEVSSRLAQLCGCDVEDVWLCNSGMNAFYSGFRAVQAVQQSRGRTYWVQLGWMYLDSGCVLKIFLEDSETLEYCYDLTDTDTIVAKLSALGNQLAGVVIECPSNPLVQIGDLERVSKVVRQAGGLLIIDPTAASVYNMDVLPYADVLVTSLTKYAAHAGDVMAGSLVLNVKSPDYTALKSMVAQFYIAPHISDLRRLAYEMQDAVEMVDQMNANAARLAEFLHSHPAVSTVHYAADSPHYAKYARSPDHGGAMISIELAGSMDQFYDAITVFKGPSFGTRTTLLSPFMYLAHYDLVTKATGRAVLKEAGISPELIRISVGVEPYKSIESVFAEALKQIC